MVELENVLRRRLQMGSGARESSERVQDRAGQCPGSVEEGGRSISSCPGQLSHQQKLSHMGDKGLWSWSQRAASEAGRISYPKIVSRN